jgi:hypothetical protein
MDTKIVRGDSVAQSNSSTTSKTSAASTVKVGGNVNIKATGQAEGEGNAQMHQLLQGAGGRK